MNNIESKDMLLIVLGWLIGKVLDGLSTISRKAFQKVFRKRKKPKPKRLRKHAKR